MKIFKSLKSLGVSNKFIAKELGISERTLSRKNRRFTEKQEAKMYLLVVKRLKVLRSLIIKVELGLAT